MKDKEFKIVLGIILIIVFIIGCTMIYERKGERGNLYINEDFGTSNNSLRFNPIIIKTNCSEYYEYNATGKDEEIFERDAFTMVGCILTELYSYYPNKTEEVLEKYNIIVMYNQFETSQKTRSAK